MPACPSCDNTTLRTIEYDAGTVFICGACGLQWGAATAQDMEGQLACDVSKNHYMSEASIGNPDKYSPYTDFFDFMRTQGLSGGRLLDVGCGNGVFIKHCLEKGFDAYGVDINAKLREQIDPTILGRVSFCPVEHYVAGTKTERKFDIVSFWDSFEHMAAPFEVLNKLKPLIQDNAIIYLRVNNNNDIYNLIARTLLVLFPKLGRVLFQKCFGFPRHVWNFNRRSMIAMCAKAGYEVIGSMISETPAHRLTDSMVMRGVIRLFYGINFVMGTGKIGIYYLKLIPKGDDTK